MRGACRAAVLHQRHNSLTLSETPSPNRVPTHPNAELPRLLTCNVRACLRPLNDPTHQRHKSETEARAVCPPCPALAICKKSTSSRPQVKYKYKWCAPVRLHLFLSVCLCCGCACICVSCCVGGRVGAVGLCVWPLSLTDVCVCSVQSLCSLGTFKSAVFTKYLL